MAITTFVKETFSAVAAMRPVSHAAAAAIVATSAYAVHAGASAALPAGLAGDAERRAEGWSAAGVPLALARRIATLPALAAALDIHLVAAETRKPAEKVAAVYFAAAETLRTVAIGRAARALSTADPIEATARDRALDSLVAIHRRTVTRIMAERGADPFAAWMDRHRKAVDQAIAGIGAALGGGDPSLARVTVATDLLAGLARD